MKTHQRHIYHCEKCGAIKIDDRNSQRPTCCGSLMIDAFFETVIDENGIETRTPVASSKDEQARVNVHPK